MGRPPCCDKVGVKKGPWTPEEDILLVTYIQQHGAGNWRAVPVNAGLQRCSKSCRLRWANYLRPGIRRGNFTPEEDNLIMHLQAVLGNRWAAIASYMPERTDNDIKNYWNTHLRKNLRCRAEGLEKGQWERRVQADIDMARKALSEALCSSYQIRLPQQIEAPMAPQPSVVSAATYASSTENISRLLQGWGMAKHPGKQELPQAGRGIWSNSVAPTVARPVESCSSGTAPNSADSSYLNGADSCGSTAVTDSTGGSCGTQERKLQCERAPLFMLETWLLDDYSCEDAGGANNQSDVVGTALGNAGLGLSSRW